VRHFVLIGLGSIGRRHATNLATMHPGACFTIVRHRPVVDEFCQELGARVVTDLSAIEGAVDLAVLATPSANHMDLLPTLIELGWPLLIEKPVVTESADCHRIAQLLDRSSSSVRVAGFNLRYLPSLRAMRDVIAGGELGRPVHASFTAGQWLPDWRPTVDYRTVYSADADRGGGVELDLSHEFDVARWFFGDLAIEFARSGQFSDLEITSNDTALAVLEPPREPGPVVTVTLDYLARPRVRRYEIVGDRGRLEWNIDGSLELATVDGQRSLSTGPADFDVSSSYVAMIDATLHATDTGDLRSVQSLSDGLASTQLAIGVRERGGR